MIIPKIVISKASLAIFTGFRKVHSGKMGETPPEKSADHFRRCLSHFLWRTFQKYLTQSYCYQSWHMAGNIFLPAQNSPCFV